MSKIIQWVGVRHGGHNIDEKKNDHMLITVESGWWAYEALLYYSL